jgi:hypothetical protein
MTREGKNEKTHKYILYYILMYLKNEKYEMEKEGGKKYISESNQ